MLEGNFYKIQSGLASEKDTMNLVVNLDVLQGCAHTCHGCYVNKENVGAIPEIDILNALNTSKHFIGQGLTFREIIIGSTDFFSANNTRHILRNKDLQEMTNLTDSEKRLGIATTAVFDNIDMSKLRNIFNILDSEYRDGMIIEFAIPVNVEKLINKDQKYVDDHNMVFDFFKNDTNKNVSYVFANNIHNNKWLKKDGIYEYCSNFVEENFDTVLDHNPSFFRSSSQEQIKKSIAAWKEILEQNIKHENLSNIHIPSASEYHNSLNTLGIHFKQDKAYIIPFIYEYIFMEDDSLRIHDFKNFENISNKYSSLLSEAFSYAGKSNDCSDCNYLMSCSGRNVQNVMKIMNTKDCIFPKKFRTLYAKGM